MMLTTIRLADGRRLIYFDERAGLDRSAVDRRDLPPRPAPPELRHDPLLDEWVAVATHRQDRTFLPADEQCPLCPSAPDRPTEIPAADYDVVVFENRFPPFEHCEVVCFTADHTASFADLPLSRVRSILDVWDDRTVELAVAPGVEQVFCFENRGAETGVTLHHPHGQIYGYPFVTPRTSRMLEAAARHRATPDQLAADRVVAANRSWTAFVPAAARWPFEVHLYPNDRVPDIPSLGEAARVRFAPIYLDVLRRFDRLFDLPMPYVAAWYQAPVRAKRDLAWVHLRVFSNRRAPDRLKYLAGSEAAMGVFINDIRPEDAARMLREV